MIKIDCAADCFYYYIGKTQDATIVRHVDSAPDDDGIKFICSSFFECAYCAQACRYIDCVIWYLSG